MGVSLSAKALFSTGGAWELHLRLPTSGFRCHLSLIGKVRSSSGPEEGARARGSKLRRLLDMEVMSRHRKSSASEFKGRDGRGVLGGWKLSVRGSARQWLKVSLPYLIVLDVQLRKQLLEEELTHIQ